MKKLFSILTLCLFLLAFAGCEKIEGEATVNSNLTLVDTDGNQQVISPGKYKTNATSVNHQLYVEIDNHRFLFNVPNLDLGSTWSHISSDFDVRSSESGQPVDLNGEIELINESTTQADGYESCTLSKYQHVCEIANPMNCSWRYVSYPGVKKVEWSVFTQNKKLSLKISPSSEKGMFSFQPVAIFKSNFSVQKKTLLSKGECSTF